MIVVDWLWLPFMSVNLGANERAALRCRVARSFTPESIQLTTLLGKVEQCSYRDADSLDLTRGLSEQRAILAIPYSPISSSA